MHNHPVDQHAHQATMRSDRERMLALDPTAIGPLRLSPTDIAQYIRLNQCRRYLRLRLIEQNNGRAFLRAWDAQPQAIPPLLTISGREFEAGAEAAIETRTRTFTCSAPEREAQGVPNDNAFLLALVNSLPPDGRVVVFQPLLQTEVEGWALTGIVDAIDLRRDAQGNRSALIVDFKSTTAARMEHRLQIAFYREMLDTLFRLAGIESEINLGVLYRGIASGPAADDSALSEQRADAWQTFGVEGYLERIEDAGALRRHVRSLVLGPDSEARRNLAQDFDRLPFHLDYVCDGCLYNQFCLRQSAETDDLSLIPFLQVDQKQALQTAGIRRCAQLAEVPLPQETWSDTYMQLAMAPALGADLDDLIVRARGYRESKGDSWPIQRWLPDGRQSSLPRCDPETHPNLITIFIDVEHDYLQDRVYLLGALVVGAENGVVTPERRRTVIEMAPGPPESMEQEAELVRRWIDRVIGAVVEVAAPDADGQLAAPIHLVFYDNYDQRVLMAALGRHLGKVFGATALYDFASQLAAYTSPVMTVLAGEIKAQRNFPLLCQTLQSLARLLGFPWNAERPLTTIFRERYFDAAGKFDDDDIPDGDASPWFTKRARFSSQLPLEYAYAAWSRLPPPERRDPFGPFRAVTVDDMLALHEARLLAAERIAAELRPNQWAMKASFDLSNLSSFEDVATSFAVALDEFITIERHLALGAWKHERAVAPERRVLAGASMLARYHEEDQTVEIAEYNRALHAYEMLTPDEQQDRIRPKGPKGPWRVRLRVDLSTAATSVEHAMALWGATVGDRMVLSPRHQVDTRKPVAERVQFTPSVRQLLYGAAATIEGIGTALEDQGRPYSWIDVELSSFGGKSNEFVFNQRYKGFEPGGLLTIDESPNDWYGSFERAVVAGLREGKRNALFQRLTGAGPERLAPDPVTVDGQQRFLRGLQELRAAGLLHGFEESKQQLIGGLADAPNLLVQGPPGTGKSLTASYAILARIQGAMAAGRDCRVIMACKTHAAVDELMRKLVEVLDTLARIRATHTALWDAWFDIRLLSLPIFRFEGREEPPPGVIPLHRDDTGDERPDKQIDAAPYCVVASGLAGVYRMAKGRSTKTVSLFDSRWCDLLVLDEASQINLPEAIMGALALKDDGQLIVIGDHRQMPPIVQNDWEQEVRRTFVAFRSYESLFLTLRAQLPDEHQIRFEESFRVHSDIADFLRKEIYQQDKIAYFSRKTELLEPIESPDAFVAAVLRPEHPLTVVVHEEVASQNRNVFEQELMRPVLEAMAAHGLNATSGLGVVVPHTAQRAGLRAEIPALSEIDPATGQVLRWAVDTVERFQGAERTAIVVGATESDPLYLLANSKFLFDPRRLNVAMSRAQRKLILVGSRSIFELFATDEQVFASAQLWKNLLEETCTILLWTGERGGRQVRVWGNQGKAG